MLRDMNKLYAERIAEHIYYKASNCTHNGSYSINDIDIDYDLGFRPTTEVMTYVVDCLNKHKGVAYVEYIKNCDEISLVLYGDYCGGFEEE